MLHQKGVVLLNKDQQKQIKGGYIPTIEQFCCGHRPPQWWIERYPFLDSRVCDTYSCGSGDF